MCSSVAAEGASPGAAWRGRAALLAGERRARRRERASTPAAALGRCRRRWVEQGGDDYRLLPEPRPEPEPESESAWRCLRMPVEGCGTAMHQGCGMLVL